MSSCKYCHQSLRRIRVHDDDLPFYFYECSSCGWDDYDSSFLVAQQTAIDLSGEVDGIELNDDNLEDFDR